MAKRSRDDDEFEFEDPYDEVDDDDFNDDDDDIDDDDDDIDDDDDDIDDDDDDDDDDAEDEAKEVELKPKAKPKAKASANARPKSRARAKAKPEAEAEPEPLEPDHPDTLAALKEIGARVEVNDKGHVWRVFFYERNTDEQLSNVHGLGGLQEVWLIGSKVTPAGVEKFKESLPKVRIYY
jgi:hypothetical protein